MEVKIYRCKHCGQMVAAIEKKGCDIVCCGEAMEELVPGTSDGAVEKHVPVYSVENGVVTVNVGEVDHPMSEEHYIEWVLLQTNCGNQRKQLKPNDAPNVKFALLDGEEVVSVLAYCNLHGLFKG